MKPESGHRVRMGGMARADGAHSPDLRDATKRHFQHNRNISLQIAIFAKNRKKPQAMLTISYSEFVADQAKFFDLAVRERVLIERPGKSAVALGPVSELEEYYANPDVKADILLAEKQIKKGEYRQVHADTLWDDIR